MKLLFPIQCLVALAILCGMSSIVSAQSKTYVKVENPFKVPLNYAIRWGQDGDWQNFTVHPKSVYTHTSGAGLPAAYIKFDVASKAAIAPVFREYRLLANRTFTFSSSQLVNGDYVWDLKVNK